MSDLTGKRKSWSIVLHLIGVMSIVGLIGFGLLPLLEPAFRLLAIIISGNLQGPLIATLFFLLSCVSLAICAALATIIECQAGGLLLFYSMAASLATAVSCLLIGLTEQYLNDGEIYLLTLILTAGYVVASLMLKRVTDLLVWDRVWKRLALTIASMAAYLLAFFILVIARTNLPY